MVLAPPARTRSSPAMDHSLSADLGYLPFMHNNACYGQGPEPLGVKICIFLHARSADPIGTQSALDKDAWANLACKRAASAAVGKESANPSPAAAALRTPSALTCAKASLQSRTAAWGLRIRSFRLASAIWMQARNRLRSRPPCGAAAHTACRTSCDSQKYPASLSAIA